MIYWVVRIVLGLAVLLLLGFAAERLAEARDRGRFPPPGQLVPLGGGRSLHLMCEGSGPTVVVEQGAGEPAILWRFFQRRAARFARLCLYDRAGYGWSPQAPAWQDVDARAEDLRRLLEAANLPGPYILVAHSYGGLVARAIARSHPDEVAGLLMVDAVDESIAFHPRYLAFLRQSRPFVSGMRMAAAVGIIRLAGQFGGGDKDSVADPLDLQMAAAQSARPAFFAAIRADLRSIEEAARHYPLPEGMGGLGDIPVVAITHGKPFPGPFAPLEPIWRPGQERWARLGSPGELITASNSGHMIVMDEPEVVLAALEKMVRALPSSPRRDWADARGGAL